MQYPSSTVHSHLLILRVIVDPHFRLDITTSLPGFCVRILLEANQKRLMLNETMCIGSEEEPSKRIPYVLQNALNQKAI
jgi:hypothetical protein